MTMTRGAVAPGKRQVNWKIRPDVLEWLSAQAEALGLGSRTAAADFWIARLRNGTPFFTDRELTEPVKGDRPKRTQTSWRIWEANCLWLEEQGRHLKDAKGRRLRTMPAVANYLLARCMNGEVSIG